MAAAGREAPRAPEEPTMDVQTVDPQDPRAIAFWAAQLAVTEATLRQAVAAIGTDVDKIKTWLECLCSWFPLRWTNFIRMVTDELSRLSFSE